MDTSASAVLSYDGGKRVSNEGRLVEIEKWFIAREMRGADLFIHVVNGNVHEQVGVVWVALSAR